MSNWPQYLTIGFQIIRFIILVYRDLDKPTAQEQWIGLVGSSLATLAPLWVLHMGGFFDKL